MKHRKTGRVLSRNSNQRRALLKTMLGSLVLHERVSTTEAKAKEMKDFIDQLVNKAKRARTDENQKVAMIRDLRKHLPLVAVEKLVGEFGARFEGRNSGYTRITKTENRKSDSAAMAIIEFV
ncbi:MAG: 50S ribosomal protein L17 [Candidatus Moranbacteria bacterium RIFCSPHIGHO2_01_FULL_55_24]|nr:MAG: 50S ribosomal protein L17 [Candidatus Moranbacteria bacterium RIFCSPHIGHO2_01_FULL_55_24]